MSNIDAKFITRTAMLIALAVIFQFLGRFIPAGQFVTGPLINACLIVATGIVGVWSGVTVAILSPVIALATGMNPNILFAPIIALANIVFVVVFALFIGKDIRTELSARPALGIIVGSVIKFLVIFVGITKMLPALNIKVAPPLIFAFSWPQLVTALTGGIIGLTVLIILNKSGILKDKIEQ